VSTQATTSREEDAACGVLLSLERSGFRIQGSSNNQECTLMECDSRFRSAAGLLAVLDLGGDGYPRFVQTAMERLIDTFSSESWLVVWRCMIGKCKLPKFHDHVHFAATGSTLKLRFLLFSVSC
jgi:hypothetical protein